MRKQKAQERIRNFIEVALGYDVEEAVAEAQRCLQCRNGPCRQGCPVNLDIPVFIKHIKDNRFDLAIEKIKEKNSLPAVAGRVCPIENQCEKYCVRGKKGEPVAIGRLERFAADNELQTGVKKPGNAVKTLGKVAVVGSGPAGLTASAELAKLGYEVVVFEALHVAGGVLMYGIPEFRLPKRVVEAEVEYVKNLGVTIQTDSVVGKLFTVDELFNEGFKAVFIGTGAGLPQFLHIPGENLKGVYSANEFLIRVNLMKAYKFPVYDTPVKVGRRVAVVGGGNVAMDAARTALRLGAEDVYVVYRRTGEEMPARREEIENAEEEEVRFIFLALPTRVLGDDKGWVKQIECIHMRLGEPDETGRRRPVPIEGSEFTFNADTVIVAIGASPNPLISQTTPELETDEEGCIRVNEFGETSKEGVYAGGDIATGAATVIEAIGSGLKAAQAIDLYLKKRVRCN